MLRVDPADRARQVAAPAGVQGRPRPGARRRAASERSAQAARGTDNLLPVLKDALRDRCSMGEVCGAMRDVFGEYQPSD